jgi:hypothetical protein
VCVCEFIYPSLSPWEICRLPQLYYPYITTTMFYYLQRILSLIKACVVHIVFDLLLTLLPAHNYEAFQHIWKSNLVLNTFNLLRFQSFPASFLPNLALNTFWVIEVVPIFSCFLLNQFCSLVMVTVPFCLFSWYRSNL